MPEMRARAMGLPDPRTGPATPADCDLLDCIRGSAGNQSRERPRKAGSAASCACT